MSVHFRDRREAGRHLAVRLRHLAGQEKVVVLALPCGGVPVGWEVAEAIDAPLDVFVVRQLGVPGHRELAMGAITTGGFQLLNREVIDALRIPGGAVSGVIEHEQRELARRERAYRSGRPFPELRGATVVLVDDGVATAATMTAAVHAVRQQKPASVIVAAPVMARSARAALSGVADSCECVAEMERFHGVGTWYGDFSPTSDEEVRALLRTAAARAAGIGAGSAHEDGADGFRWH